jgi:hypothetical protein
MTEPRRPSRAVAAEGGTTMEARLQELESRLAEMEERAPNWRQRGRGMMDRVMPPEAAQHFRNAAREQLLGMRAIVNFWIDQVDRMDERASPPERESIDVE